MSSRRSITGSAGHQVDGTIGQVTSSFTEAALAEEAVRPKCSVLNVRVVWAVNILESDYRDSNLSLELVSKRLRLTKSYLCRVFRREMGLGIPDYLRKVRAHEAEKMLRETLLSIKEITAAVGFAHVVQLDRVFKAHFGCTPKEYRRQVLARTVTK